MTEFDRAIKEIQNLNQLANRDQWVNRIHPLVKLFLTVFYIATIVSFSKYNLQGLLIYAVYPVVLFMLCELSFKNALYRLRVVLPLVCIVGLFNPFFDKTVVATLGTDGSLEITGGVVSMFTLMVKGVLTVLASYLLIATTTIEEICYALRKIHVPKAIVTEVLLIYRYITVLLAETRRMTTAYALRAPGQKGLHISVWGSFVGRFLLRSMDRAQLVYDSMQLRGFDGAFHSSHSWYAGNRHNSMAGDLMYCAVWSGLVILFRMVPVGYLLGKLFVR